MRGQSGEAKAEVTVKAGEDLIRTLQRSLRPEVDRPSSARSIVSLKAEGSVLRLDIAASDVTAMRAALNSYLRWVQSVSDVVDKARPDEAQQ